MYWDLFFLGLFKGGPYLLETTVTEFDGREMIVINGYKEEQITLQIQCERLSKIEYIHGGF